MPPKEPSPLCPKVLLACLNGHGFTQPTYTQTPNDIFAAMPYITDAQLRCLLSMVRWTLGYHRTTCAASYTDIQRGTGLSRPTVITTMRQLHDAGLVTRTSRYPRCTWRLNITEDTHIRITSGEPTQKPAQPKLADW